MKKSKMDEVDAEIPNITLNAVDVFDIENLPDVPFRRVLYFLSVTDVKKLRLLSKWFEKRITYLKKSLFNKFYFKGCNGYISEVNCLEIIEPLSVAMAKPHAPELVVEFRGIMNKTMIQIAVDNKSKINSLCMHAYENENLLLRPSFRFENLDRLYLHGFFGEAAVIISEAMVNKHANTLKSLRIDRVYVNFPSRRIKVPALPKLCSLALIDVPMEIALPLLEQSRPTLTSLVLNGSFMNPPPNKDFVYEFSNMKHVSINSHVNSSSAFQFIKCNAQHLVFLELNNFGMLENLEDLLRLQFPNLRELKIRGFRFLPILMNCRETLELLVMNSMFTDNTQEHHIMNRHTDDDVYANLELRRLTDLIVIGNNQAFVSKIMNASRKSLEILLTNEMSNLVGCRKMERLSNMFLGQGITAQEKERMAALSPNAEVDILTNENSDVMKNLIRSRCKQKKFKFDIASREREHFLEIFKIQVDEIILPWAADGFISIAWVPMS